MATSGSYINPIDPQGYHRYSVFGNFAPTTSLKARLLAPRRKTSLEESFRKKSSFLASGKRARNRRLAKSLPQLHVTKITEHGYHLRSQHEGNVSNNTPAQCAPRNKKSVEKRGGYEDGKKVEWWQMPKREYEVKLTTFENRKTYFKEGSNFTEHTNPPSQVDLGNQRDNFGYAQQFNSGTAGYDFQLLPTNATRDWWYSRTRSGLRKPGNPPPVKQVFAFDFVSWDNKNQTGTQTVPDIKKVPSNTTTLSRPQFFAPNKGMKKMHSVSTKPTCTSKAEGDRLLPTICIEGEGISLPVNKKKKYEVAITRYLQMLKLTCEWLKVLRATESTRLTSNPAKTGKLGIVNLNESFVTENLRTRFQQFQSTYPQYYYASRTSLPPKISTQNLPLEPFSLHGAPVKDHLPTWYPSFRSKPSEDFVRDKPDNLFPNLVIFGQQLKHLLSLGVSMPEQSKKVLETVAESANTGELKVEDFDAVQSIVKDMQSSVQTDSESFTHNSFEADSESIPIMFQNPLDSGGDTHISTADQYGESQDDSIQKGTSSSSDQSSSGENITLLQENSIETQSLDSSDSPTPVGEGQSDTLSESTQIKDSHDGNKEMGSRTTKSSQSKLKKLQAQYSKLENNVILSVREDLQYLKESMFMKREPKRRESLLVPPVSSKAGSNESSRKHSSRTTAKSRIVSSTHSSLSTVKEKPETDNVNEPSAQGFTKGTSSRNPSSMQSNHTLKTKSSRQLSVNRSAVNNRTLKSATNVPFPRAGLSRNGSSVALSRAGSRVMSRAGSRIMSHYSSPPPPQVVLDCLSELRDVRMLAEGFLRSLNPPELTISSRPATSEETGSDHARVQTRERASRAESRRLSTVVEQKSGEPKGPSEEELAQERERLAREKEERARRLQEELEQSLDTNDAVRLRRKQVAEAQRHAEMVDRERQQMLEKEEKKALQRMEAERAKHATVLEKLKKEDEDRQNQQWCIGGILEDYNETLLAWEEIDFAYISHYLGHELSEGLRMKEQEKLLEEKAKMDALVQEALHFQRIELMCKLALAQKEFMDGLENEIEDLEHLLCISRAFVYSYFTKVPDNKLSDL